MMDKQVEHIPERPLVLVVEDDLDLLDFLIAELGDEFRILSATNGREGLQQALEEIPDLIVTDLMMPVMGGVELCRELKQHPDTSHIPVIMLTAKSSVESQLSSLESGVDDYVTKPFVLKLLQARIRNLLEIRRQLHARFMREFMLAERPDSENILDRDFLQRALKVLDDHAADPEFSAERFAEKLNLSLSTLHRRLKTLTGETPAKLIWSVRLKKAAGLLLSTELKITDIAFRVGYSDSNHFGRQFKQYYGVTPSQYRDAGGAEDSAG